ncbi:MAG: hypothetical protein GXO09_04865 [Crenarchaeota archaeon]|nr:hypothetical protein [Thermoproteota archaeon]
MTAASGDVFALILATLLKLYNWGSCLLHNLLSEYLSRFPQAEKTVEALGSAFNLLVNLTVFYILFKLFKRFDKIILIALIIGWSVFALVMLGALNPHTVAKISEMLNKTVYGLIENATRGIGR